MGDSTSGTISHSIAEVTSTKDDSKPTLILNSRYDGSAYPLYISGVKKRSFDTLAGGKTFSINSLDITIEGGNTIDQGRIILERSGSDKVDFVDINENVAQVMLSNYSEPKNVLKKAIVALREIMDETISNQKPDALAETATRLKLLREVERRLDDAIAQERYSKYYKEAEELFRKISTELGFDRIDSSKNPLAKDVVRVLYWYLSGERHWMYKSSFYRLSAFMSKDGEALGREKSDQEARSIVMALLEGNYRFENESNSDKVFRKVNGIDRRSDKTEIVGWMARDVFHRTSEVGHTHPIRKYIYMRGSEQRFVRLSTIFHISYKSQVHGDTLNDFEHYFQTWALDAMAERSFAHSEYKKNNYTNVKLPEELEKRLHLLREKIHLKFEFARGRNGELSTHDLKAIVFTDYLTPQEYEKIADHFREFVHKMERVLDGEADYNEFYYAYA